MRKLFLVILTCLSFLLWTPSIGQITMTGGGGGGSDAITETSTTYTITKTNIVLAGDVTVTSISFVTVVATTSITVGKSGGTSGRVTWIASDNDQIYAEITTSAQLDFIVSDDLALAGIRIINSDGGFAIINGTGTSGEFAPTIIGSSKGNTRGTIFCGDAASGDDSGTKGIVRILAKVNGGTVSTRPLFTVSNNTTERMSLTPAGDLQVDGDIDVGDDVLLANGAVVGITGNEVITFLAAGSINFTGATVDIDGAFTASTITSDAGVVGVTLSSIGGSGADATLILDANAGATDADTWKIISQQSGNDLSFVNHTTEVLNLTSAGYFRFGAAGTEYVGYTAVNTFNFNRDGVFTLYNANGELNLRSSKNTQIKVNNNIVAAQFHSGGNSGIGTDVTPDYFFDVQGDLHTDGDVTLDADFIMSAGDAEIYDTGDLASESLQDIADFSTGNWSYTGEIVADGTDATFTWASSGLGTMTQTSGNMTISGVGSRWYNLTYTITNSTVADETVTITTAFAASATELDVSSAAAYTVYFKSAVSPANFVISITGAGSGAFTITEISLKQVTGGDVAVHGLITGGGSTGIKVSANGDVTTTGTTKIVGLSQPGVTVTNTSSYAVLAANTGKRHIIGDLGQVCTITLPVEVAGLNYEFWYYGAAAETHDHIILTNGGNAKFFKGGVVFLDVANAISQSNSNGSSNSSLTLNNMNGGTFIKMFCDGTNWFVTGTMVSDVAPTWADQ